MLPPQLCRVLSHRRIIACAFSVGVCNLVYFGLGGRKLPNGLLPGSDTMSETYKQQATNMHQTRTESQRSGWKDETAENTQRRRSHGKYNILMLGADDMRPELGPFIHTNPAYHQQMFTPNIDRLAKSSMVFKHTYAQFPICDPSRTSMLTSRRPDTSRVYSYQRYFRTHGLNFTTLPQYFKNNGYRTFGMGKVFHPRRHELGIGDPPSWSEPFTFVNSSVSFYWSKLGPKTSWAAISEEARAKMPLPDDVTASNAVTKLRELASDGSRQPFFLAVGFFKPHTPIFFPEEFLEYYPLDTIKVASRQVANENISPMTVANRSVMVNYEDFSSYKEFQGKNFKPFPEKETKAIRRAYYSAISYVDSLYGKILDELRSLELDRTTIVVIWADHGFHHGENGIWGKWRPYELSLHVPLIIRIPGLTDEGKETSQMTEMVDVFPTLVEAAGLPHLPLCPTNSSLVSLCREGSSLMPLIKDPSARWKTAAFSQSDLRGRSMAYTLRTSRYRYTEFTRTGDTYPASPIWEDPHAVELYDHDLDPLETTNCADQKEYKDVIVEFSEKLHSGWRQDLPEPQDW